MEAISHCLFPTSPLLKISCGELPGTKETIPRVNEIIRKKMSERAMYELIMKKRFANTGRDRRQEWHVKNFRRVKKKNQILSIVFAIDWISKNAHSQDTVWYDSVLFLLIWFIWFNFIWFFRKSICFETGRKEYKIC